MSGISQALAASEQWEELISWGDELYHPLFQGDFNVPKAPETNASFSSDYHVPESVTSEQPYPLSASFAVEDDPSYIISAPQSIIDGPSSAGQSFSLHSTSPSYSTTATSPLAARHDGHFHSAFGGSGHLCTPFQRPSDSPVLDTSEEIFLGRMNSNESFRTTSTNTFINPFIEGSPHAFNYLDVNSSQAFNNLGGWADQPQIVEPIPENAHPGAIPIPYASSMPILTTFPSFSWQEGAPQEHYRARAITIPQPQNRNSSYQSNLHVSRFGTHVPPMLSVSPEAKHRPRSSALSRSMSRSESRRSRNGLTSPSPTSNSFGWVSYLPNGQTNKLVASGTEGNRGRRQRGRTKALTPDQRRNAALMRVIGACSNCKKRKEKCDPGTPCKACLEHYKGDLVHFPCRDRVLSDLSKTFLSDRLGWHPTARALESFVKPGKFDIATGLTYTIPLTLGFGPPLALPVHALQVYDHNTLYHKHIIYSWPPSSSPPDTHQHAVLPAVLTPEALTTLPKTLDDHLSLLVTQHFHSFPLHCSSLRVLREIYVFYRSLPVTSSNSQLLRQALKLLVLVHIGGDLTLPSPSTEPVLAQLVYTSMPELVTATDTTPTPCFIRSQLGSVMPKLALSLMRDILSSLEQLFLNRECNEWPIAFAVLATVLMTIESIHYHDAKLPYHHPYDSTTPPDPKAKEEERKVDEQGIQSFFAFYSACFSGCHARLRPDWEGEAGARGAGMGMASEDAFVESVREAIRNAGPEKYLAGKAKAEREGEDMEFFFDRLVARLLLLKT
ncbi:hypothetical protein P154DRAFT_520016 [Amniculicola lignicola CBS 123094]|uniref:Zn(2)-C6 fungal-type domain-containing protein n=1 Tax=Amniculicola lignicola CBS 123094 TaxID=1392246 RepID=A0A6A5WN85_9PLEO|nr:hypothetical protein P154DRAFT_520016 [Amniculicola lignicola CBS 123094]